MRSVSSWKEKLGDKIANELGREIDIFEQQMKLRRQGKIDEKVFAETRLRRGVYGQRYDNGQRHDGARVQKLRRRIETAGQRCRILHRSFIDRRAP